MATVRMPISLQVRATRTAISPRLAIRIFRMLTAAHPTRSLVAGAGGELRSVRAKTQRVHRLAGEIDLVMQVRARGEAAAGGSRHHLPALDVLAVVYQEGLVVAVGGDDAAAVVEDEDAAVDAVAAGAA